MKTTIVFLALCILFTITVHAETPAENAALVSFRDATNHNNWISTQRNPSLSYDTSWFSSMSVCDYSNGWFGVICDSNNHIRVLLLAANNVVGTIPNNFVDLTWLEQLYIFDNTLSGSLPANFNNLVSLTHLYMWDNSFTSVSNVANTNSLQKFYFERNSVTDNNFNWIITLPNLLELDASDNQISGTIPSTIQSASSLRKINFNNNQLSGTIPRQLLEHPQMIFVYLNGNQLTGGIPSGIDISGLNLKLANLDFGNNQLRCLIPDWIKKVDFPVDLRSNQFFCPVPASTFNMLTTPADCIQIQQYGATPLTHRINSGTSESITLYATNLDACTSGTSYECKFKDILGGGYVIVPATSATANSVTCDFPAFTTGGSKLVCISQGGGVEVGTNCTTIYTYFQCNPACANGGYCNKLTGECICSLLWQGPSCELHKCADCNEIKGAGECNTTDGTCICFDGYTGPNCKNGNKVCNVTCENGGFCSEFDGTCVCTLGWQGPSCEEVFCPECDPRGGICVNGTCDCYENWNGVLCNVPNATCPGNGKCGSDRNPVSGFCDKVTGNCECYPGWEGTVCENRICPNDCSYPNGICNTTTGECTCTGYYQLPTCVVKRIPCPNSCTSPSHGTCNYQTGLCTCRRPFTGLNCSIGQCTPPNCAGHGTCNTTTGTCMCDAPWTGVSCAIPDAKCPNDCSGVGSCNIITGECICPFGSDPAYPDCSRKLCPGDGTCSGRGTCDTTLGLCECEENYEGQTCERPNFDCPGNCNRSGLCNRLEGVCNCFAGFTGESCSEKTCNNNCTGNGNCNPISGKCTCFEGFEGDDCSLLSCSTECVNDGNCNNNIGSCECSDGFTGENCALLSCPNDCSGRGACVGGVCFCVDRFYLEDCSKQEPDYPLIVLVVVLAVLGGLVLIAIIFMIWRQVMINQLTAQIAGGNTEAVDLDAISDSM